MCHYKWYQINSATVWVLQLGDAVRDRKNLYCVALKKVIAVSKTPLFLLEKNKLEREKYAQDEEKNNRNLHPHSFVFNEHNFGKHNSVAEAKRNC
jgi:hypothetical protein